MLLLFNESESLECALSTYPRFETEAWGNSETAQSPEKNKNKIKLGTTLCISGNRVTGATKIDFNQERLKLYLLG